MSIIQLTNVNNQSLPSGVTFSDNTLKLLKKSVFKDTLTIKLNHRELTRLNIVVEPSVEAKLILELNDTDSSDVTYDIDMKLMENSQVKFLLISEVQSNNAKLNFKSSSLADSNMEFIGGFVNNVMDAKLFLDLDGKGANLRVRTITVSSTDHSQKLDIHMTHYAPFSSAEMTNVGIAGQNGIIKINGVGQIEQGMNGSSAFQTLKGIITNDKAQIDVNPILIIDEHDVKAGHAATVGKMEDEVIFYLRSRGITLEDAQRLIINGYLQPIIDEIDDELIKENVAKIVNERI
ncbi:SufD family Fe-S cluster assembly protein [Acholeplasma laidlawii]|uniref:SufD family Fe-S cluster assembly protein n=1 Tax=Acholeplasma laidlawii TaxID=2148 RepID=UPI0018C31291|nr:SufD family Fe-S cluster assembly protein [Acholeplasma laidlawii]MBG0762938.1 SufD family Fe-S cluster assembly protein [Acholeplasma laidlawii]